MEGIPPGDEQREVLGGTDGCNSDRLGVEQIRLGNGRRSAKVSGVGKVVRLMGMLWVVRHAQSEGNVSGLFVGRSESPLSQRGRRQAVAVGGEIAQTGRKVSAVVSSGAARAIQTAEAIVDSLGNAVPLEYDARLAEMDYGDWEGKAFASIGEPGDVARMFGDPSFAPPGGESVAEMCARTYRALTDLTAELDSDSIAVVVTHMGPAKASAMWALQCEESCFPRIRIDNASISKIHSGHLGRYMISINETRHLADT